MILKIENQTFEYDNTMEALVDMLAKIESTIEESSKLLSHMVVDHVEVYEDFYSYFQDNIKGIGGVEVVTLTYKELVDDILSSTVDYLNRVIPLTEELSNKFYRESIGEDWNNLKDLLEGISWLISTFSSIDGDGRLSLVIASYENWNEYSGEVYGLQDTLGDFEEAMSNQDNVAIADLLQYEIHPKFETMRERLFSFVIASGGEYVS